MLNGKTLRQQTQPAPPPIALDRPPLDPQAVRWHIGGGLALIVLGVLLVALAALVAPDDFGYAATWRKVLTLTPLVLSLLFVAVGFWLCFLPFNLIRRQEAWRERYLEQLLVEREQGNNVLVEQEYSEWSLRTDHPGAMLLALLALQYNYEQTRRIPTVRTLCDGGIWITLDRTGRSVKLLDVTEHQARLALEWLNAAGAFEGRREGAAGQWQVDDLYQAVEVYRRQWGRV
jgi:hypothetical protein